MASSIFLRTFNNVDYLSYFNMISKEENSSIQKFFPYIYVKNINQAKTFIDNIMITHDLATSFYAIMKGNEMIGFLNYIYSDLKWDISIFITHEYQNKGIAKNIMRKVMYDIETKLVAKMFTFRVNPENKLGIGLVKSLKAIYSKEHSTKELNYYYIDIRKGEKL